jgi:hypothetical protein
VSPLLLALLTACVATPLPPAGDGSGETGDAASETGTEDTSTEDDEDDGPPSGEDKDDEDSGTDSGDDDGLIGDLLDPPLAPPAFDVLALDGTPRTPDWFTGDPSVVWFFRDTGAT